MFQRALLLLLAAASHAMLAIAADPKGPESSGKTTLGQFADPLVRRDLKINGAASCSATACHGGPRAGVANVFSERGSEYPLWIERDPHSRSWRTICGDKSLSILQKLNIISDDGEISDQAAFDNCLACHNSTAQFSESRSAELLREGVGCNSCHGPSELWKSTHYQSTWQSTYEIENGFVPASDMLARARMCASCHIGDQDRDMNHDIIAAGHPALYYEFTAYHQRLPKHWRDSESSSTQRYESSQWLAGQVAALDASLTLLEARARKALPTSQWPDFANYECSACHQRLRPGSVDYSSVDNKLSTADSGVDSVVEPGVAKLSRWNRFGIEALLNARQSTEPFGEVDRRLLDSIAELQRVARLSPDIAADKVASASKSVRLQLDRWLNSREGRSEMDGMSADRLRNVLIHAGQQSETLSNWESATQFYLASVAARAAWPDGVQGKSLATARDLRSVLTFKPGTNAQQSLLWQSTSGFKTIPNKAGIQHWHAISSTNVK